MVFDWVKKITGKSDVEKSNTNEKIGSEGDALKTDTSKEQLSETESTHKIPQAPEFDMKEQNADKGASASATISETTVVVDGGESDSLDIQGQPKSESDEDIIEKAEQKPKKGWLSRMIGGLEKSSSKLSNSISGVFTKRKLDAEAIEDLQDILIMSDMGVETAKTFTDNIAQNRFDKEVSDEEIKHALAGEIESVLAPLCKPLNVRSDVSPHVILMVGVNGSGKTTTIGKLASKYMAEGHKVMLGAGDTFRAAAVEQLQVWGQRTGAIVVSKDEGADAGALVYEAIERAKAENVDVLLLDTAGRLHNKEHLMEELKKVDRVIKKLMPDAPHDTVLVLDGTVGQNAIEQVRHFSDCVDVSGLIMTKLDGSARGGVLVNVSNMFNLSVHAIGVGETADDLNAFVAKDFANGIMGISSDA